MKDNNTNERVTPYVSPVSGKGACVSNCSENDTQTERPTPKTDGEMNDHRGESNAKRLVRMRKHAADLERQLAEAREELNREREHLNKIDGLIEDVGGCTFSCINPYEDLKRALIGLKKQRDEAREQRDRLADALPIAMARAYAGGYQHGHEDTVEAQFIPVHHTDTKDYFADNVRQMTVDGSQPEAAAALTSLKGSSDESR